MGHIQKYFHLTCSKDDDGKKYGAVNEKFAMANRNNFDILF